MQTSSSHDQYKADPAREALARQRTGRGILFERTVAAFKDLSFSTEPATIAARDEANHGLVHLRDLGPDAVHTDLAIQNMSIRYANDEYIGERLLPVATVSQRSNIFYHYDERAQLAFPSDAISARGEANEVVQAVTKDNYYTSPHALQEFIDLDEIGNADAPLDPLYDATILVNEGLAFNRELRIATLLSDPAQFAANTVAIQPGQEWNSASGGAPTKIIRYARDAVWAGPTPSRLVGYCSVNVFRTLSQHPSIRDLFKYTKDGFATPEMLAKYFMLDELLIGYARKDNANEGQALDAERIWPDVFGIVRVALLPSTRTYCFGTTFRWGAQQSQQWFEQKRGRNGGYYTKVSCSETHKVVAGRAGYLITGCIDPNLLTS